MTMTCLAFTADQRRAACIHEAGHAVVHAMGGSIVYRVAVAPEGDTGAWTYRGRKGGVETDLRGICEASDHFMLCMHMGWDEDERYYRPDRRGFEHYMRTIAAAIADYPDARRQRSPRAIMAEERRRTRANLCAVVAGPIAEQIYMGEDVYVDEPDDWDNPAEDIVRAWAIAGLLPFRREFDHAVRVTEAAIREPETWGRVVRLADELERVGEIEDVDPFLPERTPAWPPTPRAWRWTRAADPSR
jgi:hypothetical protein